MKKILLVLAFGASFAFAECQASKEIDRMTETISLHIQCDRNSMGGNLLDIKVDQEKGALKFQRLILMLKDDAPKIFYQQKDKLQSLMGQEIRIKFNRDDPIVGEALMFGDEVKDFANGFLLSDDKKTTISEPLEKLLVEYRNTSAGLEYLELDISELNSLIK
jgi:hypothetical protein|nr:MAG TPA: hypothetical protein [Caudoviricetes sp.]